MELSAQSGADGTFSLEGVPVLDDDVEIVVSAQGYTDTATVISAEDLISDGTTSLGDVSLDLPASETGAFGVTSLLANNFGYITRTLSGVVFRFEGERTFNGWIELFIDTKESGDTRGATDAMYSLKADGTVSVTNYGGSFTTEGIEWTVNAIDGGVYGKTSHPLQDARHRRARALRHLPRAEQRPGRLGRLGQGRYEGRERRRLRQARNARRLCARRGGQPPV